MASRIPMDALPGSTILKAIVWSCGTSEGTHQPVSAGKSDQPRRTGTWAGGGEPLGGVKLPDVTWCAGSSIGMCVGNINPGVTVDPNVNTPKERAQRSPLPGSQFLPRRQICLGNSQLLYSR